MYVGGGTAFSLYIPGMFAGQAVPELINQKSVIEASVRFQPKTLRL